MMWLIERERETERQKKSERERSWYFCARLKAEEESGMLLVCRIDARGVGWGGVG